MVSALVVSALVVSALVVSALGALATRDSEEAQHQVGLVRGVLEPLVEGLATLDSAGSLTGFREISSVVGERHGELEALEPGSPVEVRPFTKLG